MIVKMRTFVKYVSKKGRLRHGLFILPFVDLRNWFLCDLPKVFLLIFVFLLNSI
jgi:hypothetical protein